MEFFHIAQELSNLIWLGLATIVLKIKWPGSLRMLKDMVTAADAIEPVTKCSSHFAEVGKTNIKRTSQHLFMDFPGLHAVFAQS